MTAGDSASTANGVSCDVSYRRLDKTWAERLDITEATPFKISASERIRHLNELALMPETSKSLFASKALRVMLTGGTITEFDRLSKLRGVTPPGWEGTNLTWDDVPGTASVDAVWLGDSGRANNAASLAIHEATHAVDMNTQLSETSTRLQALYAADRTRLAADRDSLTVYRLGTIAEYLAVAIDEHSCNASTRRQLAQRFPELSSWVETEFERELAARPVRRWARTP